MMNAPASNAFNWRLAVRVALIAAAVIGTLYLMTLIPKTMAVFIIAILIAYGLAPIVRRLGKRMPRAVAIAVVYVGLIIVAAVLILVIMPAVLEQTQRILDNSPAYVDAFRTFADNAQLWLKAHFGKLIAANQVAQMENASVTRISGAATSMIGAAGSIAVEVANAVFIVVFGVMMSYFLLASVDAIRASFYSLFPDRMQQQARFFAAETGRVVGGFIVGQVTLCSMTFVMTLVGLLIVRAPFALLIAVLSGVMYAIPYFGVVIATVAGFLLGSLESWQTGVLVAIVIMLASKLSDFLVPKVMGDSVGVSPLAILFAVLAGGELFGLWGLILAIPAAALFKVVWTLWLHPWLTGRPMLESAQADAAA
jgi:predicted PurR-regulated permease PerM